MPNILYGEGAQPVVHVPCDALYRTVSTTGTYEVVDLRESLTSSSRTVQASAAATADAATETLTEAAGPAQGDAFSIPVTVATDFVVGHTYRIEDSDGKGEPITVAGVDTGGTDRLITLTPLINDYPIGSTVFGVELSGTVPLSLLDDDDSLGSGGGPYAVLWRYTIDSIDYVVLEPLFVKRYSYQPPITIAQALEGDPTLAYRARGRVDLQAALKLATEDVYADLHNARRDPTLQFDPINLGRAVRCRTLAYANEWLRDDDSMEAAERWHTRYGQILAQITRGLRELGSVTVDNINATAPAGSSTERRGLLAES